MDVGFVVCGTAKVVGGKMHISVHRHACMCRFCLFSLRLFFLCRVSDLGPLWWWFFHKAGGSALPSDMYMCRHVDSSAPPP